MNRFFNISLLIICISSLLLSSCMKDPQGAAGRDESVVTITVRIPSAGLPMPKTRTQTTNEARVEEIKVVVFDENGNLNYIADGTIIDNVGFQARFNVNLISSTIPISLYIVANASAAVEGWGIVPGITSQEFSERLIVAFPETGTTAPFPMIGRVNLASLDAGVNNNITGVMLLRAVARADINVDSSIGTGTFRMADARIFRSNNIMRVLPEPEPADWSNPSVTVPTTQGTRPDNAWPVGNPTTPVSAVNNQIVEGLYLSETDQILNQASQVTDATCIVVGGYYMGSQTLSYYRIDFNSTVVGHPYGQILRNHRYVFNVTGVNASGWPTPEQAAQNISSGITAEVRDWDDNVTDMYFDGRNYFGVSNNRTANLGHRAMSAADIIITTDALQNYTIEWTDQSGNPLGTQGAGESFTSNYFQVDKVTDPDGTNRIHFVALSDNRDQVRTEYMTIHAGQWNILVTINQQTSNAGQTRTIRVFSPDGAIGSLGSNTTTIPTTVEMKNILQNPNYFGPAGVVQMLGFDFDASVGPTVDALNTLTDAKLGSYDIILMSYDNRPNDATAQRIMNWLAADPHRVLMVEYDWKVAGIDIRTIPQPENYATTNANIIKRLWNQNEFTPFWFNDGTNNSIGDYPARPNPYFANFVHNESSAYFWRDGPFTSGQFAPIAENEVFYYNTDNLAGFSTIPATNTTMIPLFVVPNDPGAGSMMLGVDPRTRIVYVSDGQWWESVAAGYQQNGRIQANGGVFATGNSYARLMANIWAWMIEEVVLVTDD